MKRNTAYNPRVASEIFGTAIIKSDEFVLLVKAATESGTDLETACEDAKMIDKLLHMKKLHFAVSNNIKYTRAGHLKKDSSLYACYMDVIEARLIQDKLNKESIGNGEIDN